MLRRLPRALVLSAVLAAVGCDQSRPPEDASLLDGAAPDAGSIDGGSSDGGSIDASSEDAGGAVDAARPSDAGRDGGGLPPPTDSPAELPAAEVDVTRPSFANVISVAAGEDLQAALDRAEAGDAVLLEAGATWEGNFRLRARGDDGWALLATEGCPVEGRRITPADGPLARLRSPSSEAALRTDPGAAGWRVECLDVGYASSVTSGGALIDLRNRSDASSPPQRIVIDRVRAALPDEIEVRRCLLLNADDSAVIHSWLAGCHHDSADAQAILTYNSRGPLLIEDNFLEGSGENFMACGATPTHVPSDITIRRNHFYKPRAWFDDGLRWSVKNLFELKCGHRILVEANVFENNWSDSQNGFAWVLKTPDGTGGDWTFRYNALDDTVQGVNVAQQSGGAIVGLLIEQNLIRRFGADSDFGSEDDCCNRRAFQLLGASDVVIRANTFEGTPSHIAIGDGTPTQGLRFVGNVVERGRWGLAGSGTGEGQDWVDTWAPDGVVTDNAFIGAECELYPAGNVCPADPASVPATAGADATAVTAALAGVRADVP